MLLQTGFLTSLSQIVIARDEVPKQSQSNLISCYLSLRAKPDCHCKPSQIVIARDEVPKQSQLKPLEFSEILI